MFLLDSFRLDLISDGFFEDDADTFVRHGVEARRPAGAKVRAKKRIRVGFNSLLVRGQGHTVVVDPGVGDKSCTDSASEYAVEFPRRFFPTLSELGVGLEEVDTVVLTHLHWDHCGAATRRDENGLLIPSFPRAKYYVQKREIEAAQEAATAGDDSYNPEDFNPLLLAGCLEPVDGDGELFPGMFLKVVGGHSPGLQIVYIGYPGESRAVYLSDLVPTTTQIPLDCGLSYDVDPEELRNSKKKVLSDAARDGSLLLFVHAPRVRAGVLRLRADGQFRLERVEV